MSVLQGGGGGGGAGGNFFFFFFSRKITQPTQNGIGPSIRIGRDISRLPYAGFLYIDLSKDLLKI